MKPWIKYINQLNSDEQLLSIYRQLRQQFQKEGWSEKDLEKPPYYTKEIMSLFERFGMERKRLGTELTKYFGNLDLSDYMDYIQHRMVEVDKETPLSDKKYNYKNYLEDGD